MLICPNCNHHNPDGAVQCEACYTPLPTLTACPSCSTPVQADASFCGQCGTNLKGIPTGEMIPPPPPILENDELEELLPPPPMMGEAASSPEGTLQSPFESAPEMIQTASSSPDNIEIPDLLPPDPLVQPDPIAAPPPILSIPSAPEGSPETPDPIPVSSFDLESTRPESPSPESPSPGSTNPESPSGPSSPSIEPLPPELTPPQGISPVPPAAMPPSPLSEPLTTPDGLELSAPQTRLQRNTARLLHVQTDAIIEFPDNLTLIRIGKPNDRIPPDIDVSGFPDSEIVSRVHANIRFEGNYYYIEDVGSSNGTYVNNMPLPYGNRHRLRPGDRISLGKGDKLSFIFQIA